MCIFTVPKGGRHQRERNILSAGWHGFNMCSVVYRHIDKENRRKLIYRRETRIQINGHKSGQIINELELLRSPMAGGGEQFFK